MNVMPKEFTQVYQKIVNPKIKYTAELISFTKVIGTKFQYIPNAVPKNDAKVVADGKVLR